MEETAGTPLGPADSGITEDIEVEEIVSRPQCLNCGSDILLSATYCSKCGAAIKPAVSEPEVRRFDSDFLLISLFYGIFLLICAFCNFSGMVKTYSGIFVAEISISILTLVFVAVKWRAIKPLLSIPKFDAWLLLLVPGTVIGALVINVIVTKINLVLYQEEGGYYSAYMEYPHYRWLMLYSIALHPAIFEELGFRGVFYSIVRPYTGTRNTVIITSAAFAIIHMKILSLLWLFPFALLLGYLRARYNTLWYGILLHFIFNATACVYEWYIYSLN